MKIALLGTRGIPASHGGFETCVEEIGQRLVKKGHNVWVYSKISNQNANGKTFMGMNIIRIPRVNIKGLETLFSTFLSVIHSLFMSFDMHMVFNGANSPTLLIYKIFKKKYALNTDGLEWKRDKWGFVGKSYYKFTERVSVLLCSNLVSDSEAICNYYASKYHAHSSIIAYGADILPKYSADKIDHIMSEFGLEQKKYILQVTRFEPENLPLLTLQAFNRSQSNLKCVLVGGANYPSQYLENIEKEEQNNSNIILPGFIYHKEKLNIIWQNAFCYIHGNSVGGTNPALLQAMATGRPVIALDCIFNREVLDTTGFFYQKTVQSLSEKIFYLEAHYKEAEEKALMALERVKEKYNWELVSDQYESLFQIILRKKK